ncbi:ABC transporter permease [Nocardioides humi]|uniref:ABC transporter permease n=1 Tax=Nocardioides humi TaxID=449461 RepID=UPI00319EB0D5
MAGRTRDAHRRGRRDRARHARRPASEPARPGHPRSRRGRRGRPAFVAGVLLLALFSVQLGWFPTLGGGEGVLDRLYHLALPALALATPIVAYVINVTAAEVATEAEREHVETARSRGIPNRIVTRRHIVRNALIPVTTATGLAAASMIAGGAVIEVAFGINGVGSYLVQAVHQRDIVVVQGIALLLVLSFVLVSMLIDVLYAVIDPRAVART